MKVIHDYLTIADFSSIIFNNEKIELDDLLVDRVNKSFNFLQSFSKNKVIYGVNTGFGPMAQYRIQPKDQLQLQYNLIRSHASTTGKALSPVRVKAAILARMSTMALGKSGIKNSVINLMKELINRGITPLIYAHGGVGPSGDLVQLPHLALILIGEGEVF